MFAVIFAFIAGLALIVVFSIPIAWAVMILLGALHTTYVAVPAMGFVNSLWVTLLFGLLVKGSSVSSSE